MSKVEISEQLTLDTVSTLDLDDISVTVSRSITSDGKSMYHIDVAEGTSSDEAVDDLSTYKLKVFIESSTISTDPNSQSQQNDPATKALTTVSLGANGGSHEAEFPGSVGSYNDVDLILRVDDGTNVWQSTQTKVLPVTALSDADLLGLKLVSTSKNEDVSLRLSGLDALVSSGQVDGSNNLTLSLNISEAVGLAMEAGKVIGSYETDESGNIIPLSENTNMQSVDIDITITDIDGNGEYTIISLDSVLGGGISDPLNYFNDKNDRVFEVIATVMSNFNDNVETVSAIVSPSDHPSNVEGLIFTTEESSGNITVKVNANKYFDEDYADIDHGNFEVYYDIVESLADVETSLLSLTDASMNARRIIQSEVDIFDSESDDSTQMFESDIQGRPITADEIADLVGVNTDVAHYLVLVAIMRPVDTSNNEVENLETIPVHISRAVHQSSFPSILTDNDDRNHAVAFNLLVSTPNFANGVKAFNAVPDESATPSDSALNSKKIVVEIPTVTDNNGISGVPSDVSYNITHTNDTTTTDVSRLYTVTEAADVSGNITATITASDNHLALGEKFTVTPTVTYRNTVESDVSGNPIQLGFSVSAQNRKAGNNNTELEPTGVAGNVGVTEYVQELEPVITKAIRVVPDIHTIESSDTDDDNQQFEITLDLPGFDYENGSKSSVITDVGFGGFTSNDLVLKVTFEASSYPISNNGNPKEVQWVADGSDNNVPEVVSGLPGVAGTSKLGVDASGDTDDTVFHMFFNATDVSNNLSNDAVNGNDDLLVLTFGNILPEKTYTVATQFLLSDGSFNAADLGDGATVITAPLEKSNYNIVENGTIDTLDTATVDISLNMTLVPLFGIDNLKAEQSGFNFSWANLKETYDSSGSIIQESGAGLFSDDDEFLAFPNVTDNYKQETNVNMIKILMYLYDDVSGNDVPILALHTGEAANIITYTNKSGEVVRLIDDLVYFDANHFEGVCLSGDKDYIMVKLNPNSSMLAAATPFKIELFPVLLEDDHSEYETYRSETYVTMNKENMKGIKSVVNVLVDESTAADVEHSLSIVTASPIDFDARVNVDSDETLSASTYIEKSNIDASYNLNEYSHWIDEKGGVLDYIRVELYEGDNVKQTKYVKPYYTQESNNNTKNASELNAYSSPDAHVNDILVEFNDLDSGGATSSSNAYETLANVGIRLVPVVDYDHTNLIPKIGRAHV